MYAAESRMLGAAIYRDVMYAAESRMLGAAIYRGVMYIVIGGS